MGAPFTYTAATAFCLGSVTGDDAPLLPADFDPGKSASRFALRPRVARSRAISASSLETQASRPPITEAILSAPQITGTLKGEGDRNTY